MAQQGQPDVVVTGLGIISCLGISVPQVIRSLQEGRSGIVLDAERSDRFQSSLTGRIEGFDPREFGINRKLARTMSQPAMFAYAAARQAIADAGLTPEHMESDRCGLVFGNDTSVIPVVEAIDTVRKYGSTHMIGAGNAFQSMNSTVTMNLAAQFGTRGANWTISAACASGAHAVGQGLMLIRSGLQDRMIVGGAQELNWESVTSFDALGVFSKRQDDPTAASRPFDRDRDGLVPSGGAACLILERQDIARARGATIHARIAGYGFSSGISGSLSQPCARGAERAMRLALEDAAIPSSDVDYINAHATSTPVGDLVEAEAIHRVFGSDVPVSSTKSMTGHECWMSGASEILYTILMAKGGFIAPNLNFVRLDDGCAPIRVVARTTPALIRVALSNSFGFGGTNASVVVAV